MRRLRSLAKINLDLRVLHKRPDGFHELRTIFQTISLADTIEVEYQRGRSKIELKSNIDIPANLIVTAVELAMRAMNAKGQLRIRLTKRIPTGWRPWWRIEQCGNHASGAPEASR